MKRLIVGTALFFVLAPSSPAHAAGMIIDSIKAHVEQNQTRPRQVDQRQVTPAPQNALEQWVRSMLDSLARSK